MRVLLMEQMSLDEWNEKSMKENDLNEADGMKQEVDSKDSVMHLHDKLIWRPTFTRYIQISFCF